MAAILSRPQCVYPASVLSQSRGWSSFVWGLLADDAFFDLRLNKRLSKQWWGWWFETPSRPLWRQCDAEPWHYYRLTYQSPLLYPRWYPSTISRNYWPLSPWKEKEPFKKKHKKCSCIIFIISGRLDSKNSRNYSLWKNNDPLFLYLEMVVLYLFPNHRRWRNIGCLLWVYGLMFILQLSLQRKEWHCVIHTQTDRIIKKVLYFMGRSPTPLCQQ